MLMGPTPLVTYDAATVVSDEELMRRFHEFGERCSFEALLKRYEFEIYNYLRRYLGDDTLAEDAFQTTFLRVFQKSEQFDASRRFRPWLYGIATHQAIDLKRRSKRQEHQSLDSKLVQHDVCESTHASAVADYRQSTEDPLVAAEFSEFVQSALEELGEPGRSAVELVHLQGLPYRDAAEILRVPVGTVKSRVHTALRKLADIWQRMNYERFV